MRHTPKLCRCHGFTGLLGLFRVMCLNDTNVSASGWTSVSRDYQWQ